MWDVCFQCLEGVSFPKTRLIHVYPFVCKKKVINAYD